MQMAAMLGMLAVGIGAFGAHGLEPTLEANGRTETFETAVKYHFYHSLAILALAIWLQVQPKHTFLKSVMGLLVLGILIFSGSLYVLSLTGINWLGAITPIGGVAFIAGWFWLFWSARKLQS
ncbi:hypothetical protein C943_04480 [Mariniradius saccharolyticus AK6]|uniref:DUF423 domain-containing protein n=1 Tax=Mariniradius saccharolyticus AK6 TaxID=1239962 RepID=M7Y8T2_9BACT|nr:hypothetical protein C943_04480 [Mariniradius saccharolyticus AK6]